MVAIRGSLTFVNGPPYADGPPPPQKKMSGCVIALIVGGVVLLLGSIAVGIGVYAFATSKVGKTAFKVIGEGTKIAERGLKAPGTPEIRALGCEQAMVLDMKDFAALMSDLVDAGTDAGMPDGLMITCQVQSATKSPACDVIASTYVKAVGVASADFTVTVQTPNGKKPICESTYDTKGAPR